MQFFVDTCNVEEIQKLHDLGMVDGVTTNPSLAFKEGRKFLEVLEEICGIVKGPVSAEVVSDTYKGMIEEAKKLLAFGDQVTVKVPLTPDGLRACRTLTNERNKVNVTLCFSGAQALLAAKSGATYISPFIGRLDDMGQKGVDLISDIKNIYKNYPEFNTKILAASIRSVDHVIECAKIGADVATVPPKVLWEMYEHELTTKGIEKFTEDWNSTGDSIL